MDRCLLRCLLLAALRHGLLPNIKDHIKIHGSGAFQGFKPYLQLLAALAKLLGLLAPEGPHQALSHDLLQCDGGPHGEGVQGRGGPGCIQEGRKLQQQHLRPPAASDLAALSPRSAALAELVSLRLLPGLLDLSETGVGCGSRW